MNDMRFAAQPCRLIAIIDDNDAMQDSLCDLIESAGFEVRCFWSAKQFLDSDLYGKVAGLIVDIFMPEMSGLELQAKLKEKKRNIPIIFITAFEDAAIQEQVMREGAMGFLIKPFDHQLLLKMLRSSLDMSDDVVTSRCA